MIGTQSLAWRDATEATRMALLFAQSANTSSAASLSDAAEEIAQFFSETRTRDRPLKERGLRAYESPMLSRVEQIEALLEVLWDGQKGREDPRQLSAQLLTADPSALDRTLKSIEDPTERFLMLSYAVAQASARGERNPVLDALHDRADALWARNGVRIRADVNIAQGLSDAEDKGAKDRQAYHDAVLDAGTLPRTLTLLLARYGDGIESAVGRLRQALGADMGAVLPSLPVERLRAILHELFILGAVLPFLKNCRDLGRRTRLQRRKDQHLKTANGNDADEGAALLGDLAEWVPRWLTSGDVRLLLYQYGLNLERETEARSESHMQFAGDGLTAAMSDTDRLLVVLHGIRAILRQVPDRLFPDGEHKLNADQVLGSLLDNLILGEADEPPQPQT